METLTAPWHHFALSLIGAAGFTGLAVWERRQSLDWVSSAKWWLLAFVAGPVLFAVSLTGQVVIDGTEVFWETGSGRSKVVHQIDTQDAQAVVLPPPSAAGGRHAAPWQVLRRTGDTYEVHPTDLVQAHQARIVQWLQAGGVQVLVRGPSGPVPLAQAGR